MNLFFYSKKHFLFKIPALILASFLLLTIYSPTDTLKSHLQTRQNGPCTNHAMGEFVPNPDDCKYFYWCGENGEAVAASCPPNMLFNPENKLCDTADNVQCEITTLAPATISPSLPESPSNAEQYCYNMFLQQPSSNALVFLAHPNNCHQYFMCYHGQALLQDCSFNLHWNSKIGKCDLPSNAHCLQQGGSNTLPPTMSVPTPDTPVWGGNSIICPSYGQHIFPHMERCDFFIYCVKGYAILQKCPFYHYFDIESSRCKWRNMAVCVKDLNLQFRNNKV